MHPPLKFSGIRRSITAIACTAAIVISAGFRDSSSPELSNSSPNQTLQSASVEPTPEETAADQRARALLARITLDAIAVIGTDADTVVAGGGSGLSIPTYSVSPLEGIRFCAGTGATVQHLRGYDPVSSVAFLPGPDPVPSDFLTPAGGQGRGLRAEYFLNPDFSGTPEIDRTDPYAGINGGFFLFQGFIAASPHFPEQVATANPNNIVVMTAAGDVSPSGKLPVTMPVDDTKTPISPPEQFPGTVSQDVADQQDQQLTEGIFVGYRGYEQFNIQPQYPFGHGLSYTTFAYSNLRTTPTSVTVNVTNSGEVAGSEIVPVYAGKLPTPLPTSPQSLAGFAKVALQPGRSHDAIIVLAPESLSYWDVTTHAWVAPAGNIPIMGGASSADIRLNGPVQTAATTPAAPPAAPAT